MIGTIIAYLAQGAVGLPVSRVVLQDTLHYLGNRWLLVVFGGRNCYGLSCSTWNGTDSVVR